jgi:hypothetical protein
VTRECADCPTEQPRCLEPDEIRAIASRWLGPVTAETLVRDGTALTVLRTMAVNRVLAGMTMTPAVERILEDLLAAGIDIRAILAGSSNAEKFERLIQESTRALVERGGAL